MSSPPKQRTAHESQGCTRVGKRPRASANGIAIFLLILATPLAARTTYHVGQMHEVADTGEVWFEKQVDLTTVTRSPGHPYGIFFGGLASHEIFWDGKRIGGGGVVGRTAEEEIPGPIEAHYVIPDPLAAPGLHLLQVRASAFHRGFEPQRGYWTVFVADYDRIVRGRTATAQLALVAMSGIVLTAIFALALFFVSRRDRSFLLLGTVCITAAVLLMAEAWRSLFGYTYDWHLVRLLSIVTLSWLVGVQLVALVITRFPHRYGRLVLAATTIAGAAIPFFPRAWDWKALFVLVLCGSVATLWSGWAVARRLHGGVLALIGVGAWTASSLLFPAQFLDYLGFFALNFLFVCLLCSHAVEVRRQHMEKARLEMEILRRHLQPHFLMNTLTALSEWIEQDPKTAVRMIESLADELRVLSAASTRRLVPAAEELALCRNHLQNMSLRKDVMYALDADGVDGARLVPPAVFHTLVENAITHGPSRSTMTLRLSEETCGGRTRYVFEAPAGSSAAKGNGEGTRYIEARLREVWGSAWSFRQWRAGDHWRAEIEVPS